MLSYLVFLFLSALLHLLFKLLHLHHVKFDKLLGLLLKQLVHEDLLHLYIFVVVLVLRLHLILKPLTRWGLIPFLLDSLHGLVVFCLLLVLVLKEVHYHLNLFRCQVQLSTS